MRLSRVRIAPRRILVAAALAAFAFLVLWWFLPRRFEVKVVNRTTSPMARVRLVLASGTRVELADIPPGQSARALIGLEDASDVRLLYDQADGVANDLVRVRFPPRKDDLRENKVVLGVMSHMIGGKPATMRCYVKRRQLWDPARFLSFAPGAGD